MAIDISEDKAKELRAVVREVVAGMSQLLVLGEPWVDSHMFDACGSVAHWRDVLESATAGDAVDPGAAARGTSDRPRATESDLLSLQIRYDALLVTLREKDEELKELKERLARVDGTK